MAAPHASAERAIHRHPSAESAAQAVASRWAAQRSTGTGWGDRGGAGHAHDGQVSPAGQGGQVHGAPPSTEVSTLIGGIGVIVDGLTTVPPDALPAVVGSSGPMLMG